jgi:hypothetical protein
MNQVRRLPIFIGTLLSIPLAVHAQSFSSGSTGADGPLDLSTMSCPDICLVQLPESGILNYTTVNIPSGKILMFKNNSRNTPVIMLAQGAVNVAGGIDVSAPFYVSAYISSLFFPLAVPKTPGPGGFYGGAPTSNGFGPGGGVYGSDSSLWSGRWVGPLSLVPIVGGSGGAGHLVPFSGNVEGGGGGGAILIASSTSITLSGGQVRADGFGNGDFYGSATGSGGAVRLIANSISASGSFSAVNRRDVQPSPNNYGVVRLEAPIGALNFTGSSQPAAVLSTINPALFANAMPVLRITSVGGFPVPAYAGGRFDTVDVLLPNQLPDPIQVVVTASNVPVGTEVTVGLFGSTNATATPGTLVGSFDNSSATPTISNLTRSSVTYLLATAIFDPPASAQNFNPKGPDRVAKMRIESPIGAKPKFLFLRSNGTIIDQVKLPKAFLQQLGL